MTIIDHEPNSSNDYRDIIHALFGVWITPLESSRSFRDETYTYTVSGYADEHALMFVKNEGYTFEFTGYELGFTDASGADMLRLDDMDFDSDPAYGKVIRSHEEVKAEMDRLWEGATYDEKFILRRLYEFMQEPYPID